MNINRVVIESVPVIRDIFQAPIYVLHAKSTNTPPKPIEWIQPIPRMNDRREIIYDLSGNAVYQNAKRKYTFTPSYMSDTEISKLPTLSKARIIDAMLMLFGSQNKEQVKKGIHPFRFRDINIALGRHPKSKSNDIVEAIHEYMFTRLTWIDEFDAIEINGVVYEKVKTTTSFSIVKKSSLFGETERTHIGRSLDENTWHWVQYDEEIINRFLTEKASLRYFMADIIKVLSPTAFAVYRYFFGFGDNSGVMVSLDKVKDALAFKSDRKSEFKKWLERGLKELYEHGLIKKPRWGTKDKAICVNCKSQIEIKETQLKECITSNLSSESALIYNLIYENGERQKFEEIRKVLELDCDTYKLKNYIVEAVSEMDNKGIIKKVSWLKNNEGIDIVLNKLDIKIARKINPDFKYRIRCSEVDDEVKVNKIVRNITPSDKARKGASKTESMTDLEVLSEYRLKRNDISETTRDVIDLYIEKNKIKEAIKYINSHVINADLEMMTINI